MDMRPDPFVPPTPLPRTVPPSRLEVIRTVLRNPLELWGEPSYTLPWIRTSFFGQRTLIVNDPGLIKHVLVDNANNYRMSDIRQLVLRPILRDGLLTAEGSVWKRSRKAVAPVFTPRHAKGFATQMLAQAELYAKKYEGADGTVFDIGNDMTELAFAILSETLFSGEIVTSSNNFADDVDDLLHSMGRVDPMDLLRAPSWVPRVTRIGGLKVLGKFRKIVRDTMDLRLKRMKAEDLKKYGLAVPVDPTKIGGKLTKLDKKVLYTPGFDAVFIPGRAADVGLIAAQLNFHDMKVPFLGSNGWNAPDFARTADHQLRHRLRACGARGRRRDRRHRLGAPRRRSLHRARLPPRRRRRDLLVERMLEQRDPPLEGGVPDLGVGGHEPAQESGADLFRRAEDAFVTGLRAEAEHAREYN